MNRLKTSWKIFKASIAVMKNHKKILLFPVLVFFFCLLIVTFSIGLMGMQNTGSNYFSLTHWDKIVKNTGKAIFVEEDFKQIIDKRIKTLKKKETAPDGTLTRLNRIIVPESQNFSTYIQPLAMGVFIVAYFVLMFLAIFFNVAFYNEIINALNGNGVSFRRGVKISCSKIPQILAWSLFSGIIGGVIKKLEEHVGFLGSWVVGLIGISWSIASIFAIPVIIREKKSSNPIKFLKNSALILKETWGESLAGYIGINIIGGIFVLLSLIVVIGITVIGVFCESVMLIFITLMVWLSCLLIFGYFLSMANHIYRCALFVFATEGIVPESFNQELMEAAWELKTGRKALGK